MAYKTKNSGKIRAYGETDFYKRIITINKKLHKSKKYKRVVANKDGSESLLNTEIHETLHAKHPQMTEKHVRNKAKRIMKKITKKGKQKYYASFKK